MTDKNAFSPSVVEAIAGFTAGVISTLCFHPLDLIKTRLQVDRQSSSRIGNSLRVISWIYQNEGGISAFYRGLSPNIIGNSTSWAFYFLSYGKVKQVMQTLRDNEQDVLGYSDYFIASGTAGLLTAVITNPIWVIKTRMLSTGSHIPGAYKSFASGAKEILRTEGIAGFYRGLLPALFGVSHGALQFMAYEKLKLYRLETISQSTITTTAGSGGMAQGLSNTDLLLVSSLSKIFAGCITYPYQVLRARLQTYDAALMYRGVADATVQIWRREGIKGYYKGLGPNLLRVLPSTWMTFLVYENTKAYLTG
ncbi:hypothetical protein DTO166G5_532 [Paecilomyces variotii]|nr:hypothetical protein DTO166G5_532 [Paecilomyces variotii]KAJ9272204.1 hypothetical protein DTO212C5_1709 [Paecilomyces variotii]